ncbi:MAG TPA: hypothetical protein VGF06_03000 [Terriglobales bacterium]|jgi:hypothetical protein
MNAMTLMDAKVPDLARERRRRILLLTIVIVIVVLAGLAWGLRYWPEEHVADKFFAALQKQDYETAYGVYFHDPGWKQHPQQYAKYPYNEFYTDWGPGGEWGLIKNYKIEVAGNCPGGGSGVVVQIIVNGRSERARLYIEKVDKTVSLPPC